MLKKLVRQNWPYVLTAIAGTIMFILKFSQGSWQVGILVGRDSLLASKIVSKVSSPKEYSEVMEKL
ncbi:TPA: hypothetical protein ACIRHY_000910 [Streptococcus suis]